MNKKEIVIGIIAILCICFFSYRIGYQQKRLMIKNDQQSVDSEARISQEYLSDFDTGQFIDVDNNPYAFRLTKTEEGWELHQLCQKICVIGGGHEECQEFNDPTKENGWNPLNGIVDDIKTYQVECNN